VAPEVLAAARARAAAIVEETQTVLLRASDTDPARAAPSRRFAAALDSGKVLLRAT
jgi:hypothetical protein